MRIMFVTSWNYPVSVRRHIKDTCFFSFQFNLMSPRATKKNRGMLLYCISSWPTATVGGGLVGVVVGGWLLTPSTSLRGYKTGSTAGFLPNHPDRAVLHLPHKTSKVKVLLTSKMWLFFSSFSCLLSLVRWRGDLDCVACRSSSVQLCLRPSVSSSR